MNTQEAIQILEIMLKKADIFEEEALTYAIEHMKRWQWQPIETCPNNLRVIIGDGIAHKDSTGIWWSNMNGRPLQYVPTHWHPLPDAPEVMK